MRKVKDLRKWIAYYDEAERLVEEVALALEYYKEEITTEEEVDDAYGHAIHLFEEVELKNMLRAEEDNLGAVLKINAGAGGTESQDWASMITLDLHGHGLDAGFITVLPVGDRGLIPLLVAPATIHTGKH